MSVNSLNVNSFFDHAVIAVLPNEDTIEGVLYSSESSELTIANAGLSIISKHSYLLWHNERLREAGKVKKTWLQRLHHSDEGSGYGNANSVNTR